MVSPLPSAENAKPRNSRRTRGSRSRSRIEVAAGRTSVTSGESSGPEAPVCQSLTPPARRARPVPALSLGVVSPGCSGIRRTNQSDRGSATGSTRAAAVSTVAPSAPASTSDRSSELTCGRSFCSWATRRISRSTSATSTTSLPR